MATMREAGHLDRMPTTEQEAPPPGGFAPDEAMEQDTYDQSLGQFVTSLREGIFGGNTPDGENSRVVDAMLAPGASGEVAVEQVADAAAQAALMTWGAARQNQVEVDIEVAVGGLLVASEDMMLASGQQWTDQEKGQIRSMAMRRFQEGAQDLELITVEDSEAFLDAMQEDPQAIEDVMYELDPEGAQVLAQEGQAQMGGAPQDTGAIPPGTATAQAPMGV